jgi:hypothetical protein
LQKRQLKQELVYAVARFGSNKVDLKKERIKMIKLTVSSERSQKPVPQDLENRFLIFFHVDQAGGEKCEADYFATPSEPWFGHTELNLALGQELSVEKIEELRKLLEERINNFNGGCTWFVEIATAVTEGLEAYNLVAHSSYVPD